MGSEYMNDHFQGGVHDFEPVGSYIKIGGILLLHFARLFLWRRSYQIETSPLSYSIDQWPGFYMIGTSVIEELKTGANLKADHI